MGTTTGTTTDGRPSAGRADRPGPADGDRTMWAAGRSLAIVAGLDPPRTERPVTCPECGAAVHRADRSCPICGTLLATGPDTSAPLHAEEATHASAATEEPTVALREDTSELEGLLPLSAYPDVNRPGGSYPEPEQPGTATGPDSRRGCLGMVVVALVGLLMLAGIFWYFGSDSEPEPGVAGSSTTQSASSGSSPSASSDESPSASPTGPEPTQRASSAKQCDSVGGAVAWSGNEVTTCEFAVATAQALVDAAPDLPATVTARSPVTKKDYAMECSNTTPVVCRGGTDALVYVDLPQQ